MRLIILGVPAAGKGTQATKISENLGIPHISTGNIFRENIKNGTPLGMKAKEYIDIGLLVSDKVTQEIVKDRLLQNDCRQGFILDGFPRTIAQAEFLGSFLNSNNLEINFVINLHVKEKEVMRRISGRRICTQCDASYHMIDLPSVIQGFCDLCKGVLVQREDDHEETVLKRIRTYYKQTEPLIEYYKNRSLLVDIDGHKSVQEINDKVLHIIGVSR